MPLFMSHAYFMVEIIGKEQKDRDFQMPPNPLGVPVFFWRSRAMQPSDRMFDRDFSTPSSTDSAAVQDQRLGGSLVFDTVFTIFCSGLWWETYESVVLCNFLKGRGACWISLTDGSVSNNGGCPRLTQMEGAGGKAGSGVRAKDLKEIFGSWWNTASHVCRFDSGASTFVFLFSLVAMPSLTGVCSWESGLRMLQN